MQQAVIKPSKSFSARGSKTIQQVAQPGEFVKAGEFIEGIYSGVDLTLQDWHVWDSLIENAVGEIRELLAAKKPVVGHWFYIPLNQIRGNHESNDRIKQCVKRLAASSVALPEYDNDGKLRVDRQGNPLEGKTSLIHGEYWFPRHGYHDNTELKYGFTQGFAEALQNSQYWARIKSAISRSMRSIYSYKLHQQLSLRINRHQNIQNFDVETFRNLLDVKPGAYPAFPQFNQKVLRVAEEEINGLSDIMVEINVIRGGMVAGRESRSRQQITGYQLRWRRKADWELSLAEAERQKSDVGRRERLQKLNNLFQFDTPENETIDFMDKLKPDVVTVSEQHKADKKISYALSPEVIADAKKD